MAAQVQKPARDWRALDAAHRLRGELITVFLSPVGGAFAPPTYGDKRGKPYTYSSAHIEALLTCKINGCLYGGVHNFAERPQ